MNCITFRHEANYGRHSATGVCCKSADRYSRSVQVGLCEREKWRTGAGSSLTRKRPKIDSYVKRLPQSGGWKEVDRVDDCHCNDAIFRTEIEIADAVDNLLSQNRRLHV